MKIAVLGSYSTQILTKSLKKINSKLIIYEADYAQIDYEIINDDSQLYKFNPDFIIIHETSLSFKRSFTSENKLNENYYKKCTYRLENLLKKLNETLSKVKIIYPMLDINNDMIFGNYFFKVPESIDAQLHYYNHELTKLAVKISNLYLIDIKLLR